MSAIQPAIRSALQPAIRSAILSYGAVAWSPLTLFANSEVGVWYDPSDFSTMFQDSTGTTPVTATGQTVGLILDKSQNATLGAEKNTAPYTATGTGWSSTESSISKVLNGSNATGQLTSCEPPTAGRWYQVSFTASGLSGGTCYVRYGNSTSASTALSVRVSTAGNYTFLLLATSAAAKLQFIAYEGTDFAVTFTNISIKEITGNHAYQATSAKRPVLARTPVGGRRNLLTYTEDLSNTAWIKTNSSATPNAVAAPDGTTTADKLVENTANSTHVTAVQYAAVTGTTYVFSVYAKAAERTEIRIKASGTSLFTVDPIVRYTMSDAGTAALAQGNPTPTRGIEALADGWYRCWMSVTVAASATMTMTCSLYNTVASTDYYTGDGTSGAYLWGSQLETGSTATAYQKVVQSYDCTESGKADCYALQFDGVDDGLATGNIDFSAATGVDVFSGVRKNTNVGTQKILELTTDADGSAGAFYLRGESSGSSIIIAGQHGSAYSEPSRSAVAPANFVASGLFNRLASPYTKVRVNGAETTHATNPGIAAYVNSMLNIGARDGGASLRFNGNIYSLIVRGKTSTTPEIASAESYVAGKTGVTLP